MERSEFVLTGALILTVIGGVVWTSHRTHSRQFHPVVVESDRFQPAPALPAESPIDGSTGVSPDRARSAPAAKKDLNTATRRDLMAVHGIGHSLANNIISYRDRHGPFAGLEDVINVPGVGPARLEAISEGFDIRTAPEDVSPKTTKVVPSGPIAGSGSFSPPGGSPPPSSGIRAPVNINRATVQELERLPEIGPVLAERIVADRVRNGPYTRREDIQRVSGIGPKRYDAIRPLITVGR